MNDRSDDIGAEKISTGIAGLDDILCGGLDPDRLYLIEGTPGTGKTTLALQYLLEGSKKGEKGLYVTLSESEKRTSNGSCTTRLGPRCPFDFRVGSA